MSYQGQNYRKTGQAFLTPFYVVITAWMHSKKCILYYEQHNARQKMLVDVSSFLCNVANTYLDKANDFNSGYPMIILNVEILI